MLSTVDRTNPSGEITPPPLANTHATHLPVIVTRSNNKQGVQQGVGFITGSGATHSGVKMSPFSVPEHCVQVSLRN